MSMCTNNQKSTRLVVLFVLIQGYIVHSFALFSNPIKSSSTSNSWLGGTLQSTNRKDLDIKRMEDEYYYAIVADIGGTNSRFQLYSVSENNMKLSMGKRAPGTLIFHREYKNEQYTKQGLSFSEVLKDFIIESNHSKPIHIASIAVAGFVINNTVEFTNNKAWSINGNDLAKEVGIVGEVVLMNDFVANGYGILTLDRKDENDVVVLQDVEPVVGAPIACIGAGTGLGECYATSPTRKGPPDYTAYPSEGGHAEFAPRYLGGTTLECDLLSYLMKKFASKGRASVERVVSGPGMCNVYEFLAQHPEYKQHVNPLISGKIRDAGKHGGAIVSQYATNDVGGDRLCSKAIEIFVSAYGSEAGVAALKWLPYGGLYLAGGVTVKNINHIMNSKNQFMKSFHDKGRLSPAIHMVPLYVVMDQSLGQRGAHYAAIKYLIEYKEGIVHHPNKKSKVQQGS